MSVKLTRALYCDGRGCPNASLSVLFTTDTARPEDENWQGWREIPSAPGHNDPSRPPNHAHHLCPECNQKNNAVEFGKHD